MKKFPPLVTAACALGFSSCGTMDAVRDTPVASGISKFSFANLRPAKVAVVEVREKDLKEMPTGHERALAFENKRKRSHWLFSGPVDFKEPMLPEPGAGMDDSLLPPKLE